MKVRLLKNLPHLRLRIGAIGHIVSESGTAKKMYMVQFGVRKVHLFGDEIEEVIE